MGDQGKKPLFGTLFSEMRRRRVVRTSALYLAFAWALIEGAATIFPEFGFPEWSVRVLIGVFAAGLPLVIVLSWMFDISLKGFTRTSSEDAKVSADGHGATAGQAVVRSDASIPDKSVAVLPLTNLTGDKDDEYFADGLSEELLSLLTRTPGLKVAARTSSFAFRGRDVDVPTIAARLGVRYVLEGSVRRAGNRLRIVAQLIEAESGYHLWSDQFDREMKDIFELQDDIASAIVAALRTRLNQALSQPRSAAAQPATDDIEAYQDYLRGRFLWQRRGELALRGAINVLNEAIVRDPGFARAHAALASAQAVLHEYSGQPREEDFAIAEPRARKAIELDPSLGEPYAVLGYMALRLWRWGDAESNLRRAIELDSSDPLFHQWYANLLNDLGRHDEALLEGLAAYAIDPVSPTANNVLALTYLFMGRNEQALEHAAVAREFGVGGLVPDYVDAFIHLRRGDRPVATTAWRKLLKKAGRSDAWVEPVIAATKDRTLRATALAELDKAVADRAIVPGDLLIQYLVLGEEDRLFDLAETRIADHSLTHVWLLMPEGKSLRGHPRFLPLLRSLGLLGYWERNGWPSQLQRDAAAAAGLDKDVLNAAG